MRQLYRSVVLKQELGTKAKLSVFRSVFVPILTYGSECWVMTERVRSLVQALLLRTERPQLRWYGHVTRMSHEQTAKQLMDALPSGKRLRGRPRTRWRNYVEDLAGHVLEFHQQIATSWGDRNAWRSQLELLPP